MNTRTTPLPTNTRSVATVILSSTATISATPTGTATPAPATATPEGKNVGGIVGGIGGSMLAVAAAGFALFYFIVSYCSGRL